jgi:putative transposase
MEPSEARELRMLREENIKLKKLVADLSLDKVMLQDVLQKSSEAHQEARDRELLDGQIRSRQSQSLSVHQAAAVSVFLRKSHGPVDRAAPTRT